MPATQDAASVQTPADGIDLSGLRIKTIQQAQSELPQPKITPPWEDEPRLPSTPTTKLGKAYADAKQWLSEHEQHLSDEYLAPFRAGLDKMAGEIEDSPTVKAASPTAQGVAKGVAGLMRAVPVGKNVSETVQANIVPPELGPEGKALSRELKAGEKAEQWKPHDLGKERNLPSEEGYAYHATNEERAKEIAESGGMRTHKPWEHTDQSAWPDGSTEKRIYFTPQASSAWQFAPEEGKSVLLRVKQDAAKLKAEGTGDLYSQNPIHHKNVEIFGDDKQWHRVSDLTNPEAKIKSANEPDLSGLRTRVVSPAKAKPAPKPVEPVGIHEDDVPRRSNVPDVDWSEQDLQDSAKTVNEQTIAKDYGPKRKGAKFSVYKSHIPMEDLPSAKIVEEEEPEFQGSDWRENYQGLVRSTTPPIKVRVNPKGEMEILDGNHRAQLWSEADMTHAPAWVIDERGKGIENLSESERAERAELEEERQAELSAVEQKKRERQANLKGLGIGLTEMEPADAKNWVGYTDQKSLKIYRGVDDPSHAIEAGDYVTTSKASAQNYGKHVQELEVSPAELRYVRGHKDGDPLKLDQGGQTELIYAPKAGKKVGRPQTEQPSILIPKGLESLAAEARKSGSFDEFRKNFLRETKHGEYWHITSDPKFTIDPEKGPRDMSSLADAAMEKGKLMVTSHLENWAEEYAERRYAALIDMSEVPHEKYRQINRGFGNEFYVDDPGSARVSKVLPIEDALTESSKFDELLGKHINSDADLKQFYDRATQKRYPSGPTIDLSGLRVRPVGAGRRAAGMDTFVASDGRKYQFPSSDATWKKILKVDPGAKRIK